MELLSTAPTQTRIHEVIVEAPADPRPVVLVVAPHPVLAVLHEPAADGCRSTAVLICPPFGWEEMCAHRGLRAWGRALARAGHPAATLTLPGTGDSGGSPRDPGQLEAWTDAVAGAAGWLRARTQSERVAVVGVGLGGVIACRALAAGAAIDDVLLWGVPGHGRTLVRELRARAAVVAERYGDETSDGDGGRAADDLELTGFLLSAETERALQALSLEFSAGAGRRALLLERDGLAVDRRLRERLEGAGFAVEVEATDDYGSWFSSPQASRAPAATIEKSIAWLAAPRATPSREPRRATDPRANGPRVLERRSMELVWDGTPIVETPMRLGSLFAVLTEPRGGAAGARACAVLLNGGALSHIGPNRTWVELARHWAARGVPSARVDLRGIGDSDGEDPALLEEPSLYDPRRTAETISVLDHLQELGLPGRFILGGLCSGAYWALHAALADRRVAGALMVNLYGFQWSEELVAERETAQSLGALRGRGWRKLLRGDASPRQLTVALQSMRPGRLRTGAGRPVEAAQGPPLRSALDRLRDQRTEALLLLGRTEPLHAQLVRQRIVAERERWPNLTIEQLPTRDHMFRALWLQRRVRAALDAGLDRTLERCA
jgi:alpha-beta hydrolase superfamily lysophospholipase